MQESKLSKILNLGRKIIPKPIFRFFQPYYHWFLSVTGTIFFRFPSRKLKVIGVTGTKGKSSTVYLISNLLEQAGYKVAAIGSLGFKIGEKEWPNVLKMTMPGRWKMQKFLAQAVKAKCQYAILEVASEGIKQKRHLGIRFDCAVFTNLAKEHIESHGSFEKYYAEKQKLFKITKNLHVLNSDSEHLNKFQFNAKKKILYGINSGEIRAENIKRLEATTEFEVEKHNLKTNLIGDFNIYNILAAICVANHYGVNYADIQKLLDKIKTIPGRMEFIEKGQPFKVVIDYAHTPDSLEAVYQTLKSRSNKLICILSSAGGGRDKWKRPVMGQIASKYCDEIILTDEDPFDENPDKIIQDILSGIPQGKNTFKILDRKQAIRKALSMAQEKDTVIITGKGSEKTMALANGKIIPWNEKQLVEKELEELNLIN